MATANEELLDALLRHQTYLLRYSGSVSNGIIKLLKQTEVDIEEMIMGRLSPTGNSLVSPSDHERLKRIGESIDRLRGSAWKEATNLLKSEMQSLAVLEPATTVGIMQASAPVSLTTALPPKQLLNSIVRSRPFQGKLLKDWASALEASDLAAIKNQIQLGMTEGATNRQIVSRVMGTNGTMDQTRAGVNAVVRTAVQHVANNARKEALLENAAYIQEEVFTATLDSRTTLVCMANDNKRFAVGKGPYPPLHFGCRSLRVATFDGKVLGTRPAKPTVEKELVGEFSKGRNLGKITRRKDLPRGTKLEYDQWSRKKIRERTGPVPAETSYSNFLKRQSNTFQEETLGVTKAKLFREGKLPLDKFVSRDGSELTLSALASKYPGAFESAGLQAGVY